MEYQDHRTTQEPATRVTPGGVSHYTRHWFWNRFFYPERCFVCTVKWMKCQYCTALFCTVLYKKRRMKEEKIRKFADTQRTIRQSDNQTFQRLRPLSSSDYSRELANKFYSILFHSMTVTSSQISPMTLAMSVYLPSRPLTSLLRGCCSHNRE